MLLQYGTRTHLFFMLFKFYDNCPFFSKRKQLIGRQPIATSRSGLQADVGLLAKLAGLSQGHHGSRVLEAAQEMECQIPGSLHVSWTKLIMIARCSLHIGGMSAGCRICSVCCKTIKSCCNLVKLWAWFCRLIIGPISSIFDICTFCLLWYFYHADNAGNAAAAVF